MDTSWRDRSQADGDVNNQEFGLGLYDGITGLVTQPVKGAQKEGVVGALKGFGKGIGGIVLKPSAGTSKQTVPLKDFHNSGFHLVLRVNSMVNSIRLL